MFRKLLALLLIAALLPVAALALPVLPAPAAIHFVPGGELLFWETSGAQAWAGRDAKLFPGAADVLTVIAVEQGLAADCFILTCGGQAALIDCGQLGPDGLVPRLLAQLGVEQLDYIISTHPHDDHINGIIELLGLLPIGEIYVGFERHYRNLNKRLFREAEALGIPVMQLAPPAVLPLGDAALTVYQVPWGDNTNNRSLVTRVTLGQRALLLTADIGESGVKWMIKTYGPESFRADILKVPHHGIDIMPPDLLEAADPQALFLTYYPHTRNEETVRRLRTAGFEPLFAGLGSLVMKTDGDVWAITQLPGEIH